MPPDDKFARLVWARRPDVYNAIMALPGYSHELERELGVVKSEGMDSHDYMLTYDAITIDSRRTSPSARPRTSAGSG